MTTTDAAVPVPPLRRKVGVLLGVGIFFVPIVFAWATLRQGYSVLARAVSFLWLVLGVGVFFAVQAQPKPAAPAAPPVVDASLPDTAANATAATEPAPAAAPAAAPTASALDLATYGRIKTGMSYAAVRAIVGRDGEEQTSSDLGGIRTAAYGWSNPDGSNMTLIFQQGRLASKAQFGLH